MKSFVATRLIYSLESRDDVYQVIKSFVATRPDIFTRTSQDDVYQVIKSFVATRLIYSPEPHKMMFTR